MLDLTLLVCFDCVELCGVVCVCVVVVVVCLFECVCVCCLCFFVRCCLVWVLMNVWFMFVCVFLFKGCVCALFRV